MVLRVQLRQGPAHLLALALVGVVPHALDAQGRRHREVLEDARNEPNYQKVYEADFTSLNTPGEYQLVVPGMGASLPFLIDNGIAMSFARAYSLGLYHQRCGTNTAMPYTRHTHDVCHGAAANVPMLAAVASMKTTGALSTNPPAVIGRCWESLTAAWAAPVVTPIPDDGSGFCFR